MFGNDFNLDDLRDKLNELKDKIKITKEKDGVIVKFEDPEMANADGASNFLNPEMLKNMMPGAEGVEVEPVEGGLKFKTSDPDGFYEMISQILNPEFFMNMLQQLMDMMTKGGGLFGALGGLGADGGTGDDNILDDTTTRDDEPSSENGDENEGLHQKRKPVKKKTMKVDWEQDDAEKPSGDGSGDDS
nr:hypothetical protein [Candidatus Sigynarchaeota archaeon]